jgi:hypothetical protein
MIPSLEQLCLDHPELQQYWAQLRSAEHLSAIIWMALQIGLCIARLLVEQELGHRAAQQTVWGNCPHGATRLQSKGWQPRQIQTLVGKVG